MATGVVNYEKLVTLPKYGQRWSSRSVNLDSKVFLHLVTCDQFYQLLFLGIPHNATPHHV